MDRSWALARRMTGSPPTPYCSAANSSECSLTSLAKLRLTPPRSRTGAMHPNWLIFAAEIGGAARIPTWLGRRLATSTTTPIIAGFFCGRFEGSMAGKPVAIIMGSQSDWPTMKHTADTLDALGIGYEAKIISAHRTPERHLAFTKAAKAQGFKIIIAGAGGAAHLPGVTAALTTLPVFGVPVESKALSGVDSLYS